MDWGRSIAAFLFFRLKASPIQFYAFGSSNVDPRCHHWPYQIPEAPIGHIFLVHELSSLCEKLFNACSILGTCFNVEHSTDFFQVLLDHFGLNFPFVFQVCLCPHQKEDDLLMSMLPDLLEP